MALYLLAVTFLTVIGTVVSTSGRDLFAQARSNSTYEPNANRPMCGNLNGPCNLPTQPCCSGLTCRAPTGSSTCCGAAGGGVTCSANSDCCASAGCDTGTNTCCYMLVGHTCTASNQCCANNGITIPCTAGECRVNTGGACNDDWQCRYYNGVSGDYCKNGVCTNCVASGQNCPVFGTDCCSRGCTGFPSKCF